MRYRELRDQKGPAEVHRDDAVEGVDVVVRNGLRRQEVTGVVDDDVEAPEPGRRLVDDPARVGDIRDVAEHHEARAAGLLHPPQRLPLHVGPETSAIATAAPSPAKRSAMARPMPLAEPVTRRACPPTCPSGAPRAPGLRHDSAECCGRELGSLANGPSDHLEPLALEVDGHRWSR